MSKKTKKRLTVFTVLFSMVLLSGIDIYTARRNQASRDIVPLGQLQAAGTSPSVVTVATSMDEGLSENLPLDQYPVTTEYVREVVWRALDMDTSPTSIRNVIDSDDWVVLKVNYVPGGCAQHEHIHLLTARRWGKGDD